MPTGPPEQRPPEDLLQQSEERYRLLVESVKDYAIYMLDPEGHVVTWNEGAKRIKGYTAEEVLGRHFSLFYTPEDLASGKPQRLLEAAARDGRVEDETWRVRKDGSRFWAHVVRRGAVALAKGAFPWDRTSRHRKQSCTRNIVSRFNPSPAPPFP